MSRLKFCLVLLALLLGGPAEEACSGASERGSKPEARSSYRLEASVIAPAGAPGASTQFQSNGTLGQSTPIGTGASTNFDLYAGFWKRIEIATGVFDGILPEPFKNALFPGAPNPFNPTTTIRYEVGARAPVKITVYDILGRVVRELVRETYPPGQYETVWNGKSDRGATVASGVYLCRLQVGSFSAVQKMVLVK